jgi:hypothetical protein
MIENILKYLSDKCVIKLKKKKKKKKKKKEIGLLSATANGPTKRLACW